MRYISGKGFTAEHLQCLRVYMLSNFQHYDALSIWAPITKL